MVDLARGTQRPPDGIERRGGVRRTDGYLPIEGYAAIGDGRTLALVGLDGAIDWMCLPELDSPSVFGALLDPERGGRFVLSPAVPFTVARAYVERTNVLRTTYKTDRGCVDLVEAVTIDSGHGAPWRELVREVRGVAGTVPMRWELQPRFGFGQRAARFEQHGPAIVTRDQLLQLCLRTWDAGRTAVSPAGSVAGAFEIASGETAMLALLATDDQPLVVPERAAVERRLRETIEIWRRWVCRHSYVGPWTAAVERSLLAIRLLADGRTGAIAAAGTTSLPEIVGGQRNFDYRFGWVRDLCFTLDALLAVDMDELAASGVGWVLDATHHTHPRIDPVYSLAGDVIRTQHSLTIPGYRRTSPVRVGNDAGSQLQLGGFGDFLETMAIYIEHGHLLPPQTGERLADVTDLLARIWHNDDSGLWELHDRAHYGSSKLGSWVAFDRALELVDRGQLPARHAERWRTERDRTRAFIERHLFSEQKRSYLLKAGDEALDCAMLLAARRGFADPVRLSGTIDAIRAELHAGGPLFYRYSGMEHEENAFLACSFWMVEALAVAGRVDQAAELMQGAVALGGTTGLFSEEMEPGTHAMWGNFPQALTHLALIRAADTLARSVRDGSG